jgi:hypothetical protein
MEKPVTGIEVSANMVSFHVSDEGTDRSVGVGYRTPAARAAIHAIPLKTTVITAKPKVFPIFSGKPFGFVLVGSSVIATRSMCRRAKHQAGRPASPPDRIKRSGEANSTSPDRIFPGQSRTKSRFDVNAHLDLLCPSAGGPEAPIRKAVHGI